MPAVTKDAHTPGDYFVDHEAKVFEDAKADPDEKALVTVHTMAFERSIGLLNILNTIRLNKKGFETSILLQGPGILLGVQRGFPRIGDEAFPPTRTATRTSNASWPRGQGPNLPLCLAGPVRQGRAGADPGDHPDDAARRAGQHLAAQKGQCGDRITELQTRGARLVPPRPGMKACVGARTRPTTRR